MNLLGGQNFLLFFHSNKHWDFKEREMKQCGWLHWIANYAKLYLLFLFQLGADNPHEETEPCVIWVHVPKTRMD